MRNEYIEFLEASTTNEELKKRVDDLLKDAGPKKDETIIGKVIDVAKEYGYDLVHDDFNQSGDETKKMDEDELTAVAGGFGCCVCPVGGAGAANGDGDTGGCGCVLGGGGEFKRKKKNRKKSSGFCRCIGGGYGQTYAHLN